MDPAQALARLVERMPVGLIVWQLDDDLCTLRLLCANPAAATLTGIDLQRELGRAMLEIFPNVSSDRYRATGAQGAVRLRLHR